MSLCQHGYIENWDCPFCECPCGSGLAVGECDCQGDPSRVNEPAAALAATQHEAAAPLETVPVAVAAQPAPAAGPISDDDLLAQFAELVLTVNAARGVS